MALDRQRASAAGSVDPFAAQEVASMNRDEGSGLAVPFGSVAGFIDAESARVGGTEERARLLGVLVSDENPDGAQAVERQPVSIPQRFSALHGRNTGGLQKGPNLLRVKLAVGDKYTLQLLIHITPPIVGCRS